MIGVGTASRPTSTTALEPLRTLLGAELGATRKVTDKGWLPRARQIGITGRSIAPRLFVSIGASGKFNHTVGVRAARHRARDQPRPDAPIFDAADVGIVGDWHEALPLLVEQLRAERLGRVRLSMMKSDCDRRRRDSRRRRRRDVADEHPAVAR